MPKEVEEEKKEEVFFWPHVEHSTELLQMTPQIIRDKHREQGPFNFEPFPAPDHINRSFIFKSYTEGGGYEGEVDEDGQPDGRGVLFDPAEHFYEGYFSEGKFNGRGRKITLSGFLYTGEWK